MESFMRIQKLEFVKNIDKFENNSDEYVEINLNRKVTELSSVLYEKNQAVLFINRRRWENKFAGNSQYIENV